MSILKLRRRRPNKIVSFGCSITYGDGLDNPEYHDFIKSGLEEYQLDDYRLSHCYTGLLADYLNCDFENYGVKSNNNDNIIKQAYDYCSRLGPENDDVLILVQTTFYSRKSIYDIDLKQEFLLNSHNNENSDVPSYVKEHFQDYLVRFYDHEREFNRINMLISMLKAYLDKKGIASIFVGYDSYSLLPSPYFNFPGTSAGSMQEFANKYQLLIKDLPGIPFIDYHLTEEGHKVVAVMLKNHLEGNND